MDPLAREIVWRAAALAREAESRGDVEAEEVALLLSDLALLHSRGRDPPVIRRESGRIRTAIRGLLAIALRAIE